MKALLGAIKRFNHLLNSLSEIILMVMVLLTVIDVILRMFRLSPITGTYELVAVMGAMVIGFALPKTTWDRGHVFVDILIENRSDAVKNVFFIITRIIAIVIMALVSWNLFKKGMHLQKAGEVSMTLHVPYYPWAYILSFCFLIESITLITDIVRIFDSGEQK